MTDSQSTPASIEEIREALARTHICNCGGSLPFTCGVTIIEVAISELETLRSRIQRVESLAEKWAKPEDCMAEGCSHDIANQLRAALAQTGEQEGP